MDFPAAFSRRKSIPKSHLLFIITFYRSCIPNYIVQYTENASRLQ